MTLTAPLMPQSRRRLWKTAFRQPSVWRRASTWGVAAGILQAAINQGDFWLHHSVNVMVVAKTVASPLISFSLVLFSAAQTWVHRTLEQDKT
jgi:hypothetical protein